MKIGWYIILLMMYNTRVDHFPDVLELPESPSHLPLLIQSIPTASGLSSRLKPKPVPDPFLNQNGDVISLEDMLK